MIAFIVGFVCFLFAYYKWKLDFYKSQGINGPLPIPFLGDIIDLIQKPVNLIDLKNVKKYGKIYYDHITLGKTTLIVSDPEMIRQILVKDFPAFVERMDFPYLPRHMLKAVVFSPVQHWKRIRTIVSPVFTSGKLKRIYGGMEKPMQQFIENVQSELKDNPKSQINIRHLTKYITVDIISSVVFKYDLDSYKHRQDKFFLNTLRIIEQNGVGMLLSNILPAFLCRKLKINIFNNQGINYFVQHTEHLIEERKKNPDVKYDDFLQLLLEAEGTNKDNPEWGKLTQTEIIGQCLIFFFAGMETISTTASNVLYRMCLHPEIQEQLYAELKTLYPDGKVPFDRLNESKLLDNVLKETQRTNPSVPRLFRRAMQDFQFNNGLKVKKGQIVSVPVYSIHHDPEIYPEPFEFKPERFNDEIDPSLYLPLGFGPRHCVGARMGITELKFILINFLLNFRVFQTPDTDVPLKYQKMNLVLSCTDLHIGVERR